MSVNAEFEVKTPQNAVTMTLCPKRRRIRHCFSLITYHLIVSAVIEGLFEENAKWYIAMEEFINNNAPQEESDNNTRHEVSVPIGIARIREEWRAAGLMEKETSPQTESEIGPVVFPEVDGGAGIGDYALGYEVIKNQLALSDEAIDRLITSGEIDSILVQAPGGNARRLISISSFDRFRKDSAMDSDALKRAAKAMADKEVAEAIHDMQSEIEELRNTQSKIIQQMKDMLLLEVRNLKEQDRDLTSYIYELSEEIRRVLPKKKK